MSAEISEDTATLYMIAPADVFVAYYMLFLIPISMTLGIMNLNQIYNFYKQTRVKVSMTFTHKFFQKRSPPLIILYGIIASITSILILPYVTFSHILYIQHDVVSNHSAMEWMNSISAQSRMNILRTRWIFEFTHEICVCLLLFLIAIRAWLLYHDYKCGIAAVNTVWREMINSEDQNFWLHYKRYFGNYKVILYALTISSVLVLSVFITLHYLTDLMLYGFMKDFSFMAVVIFVFILWLYSRIRRTADRFMIRNELQRLLICVSISGTSFIVWIMKELWMDQYDLYNQETVDIHLLMYTVDIIFTYFTVYVQTKWVIRQSVEYGNQFKPSFRNQTSNSRSFHSKSNSKTVKMIDILTTKNGFEAFVNHCVGEVNVEGLLFLVEVSQWRAKLEQDGDCGEDKYKFWNIKVSVENLHRMLLEAKDDCMDGELAMAADEYMSRASSLRKRVSAMVKGLNAMKSKSSNSYTTTGGHISSKQSSNTPVFENQCTASIHGLRLNDRSSNSTLSVVGMPKQISLRARRSNTAQEDTVKKFQEDILHRDWLPISKELKPETAENNEEIEENPEIFSDRKENEIEQMPPAIAITLPEGEEVECPQELKDLMITPPPSNHGTPVSKPVNHKDDKNIIRFSQLKTLSIGEVHSNPSPESKPKLKFIGLPKNHSSAPVPSTVQGCSHRNSFAKPLQPPSISLALTMNHNDDDLTDDEKSPKKFGKTYSFRNSFRALMKATSNSTSNGTRACYRDNTTEIYNKAKYLFDKYVDSDCSLAINVSYEIRGALIRLFGPNSSPQSTFDFIYNQYLDELTQEERDIINKEPYYMIKLIKTYLYHCFDSAFDAIWGLLKQDTFRRFQKTPEFEELQEQYLANNPQRSNPKPPSIVMPIGIGNRYTPDFYTAANTLSPTSRDQTLNEGMSTPRPPPKPEMRITATSVSASTVVEVVVNGDEPIETEYVASSDEEDEEIVDDGNVGVMDVDDEDDEDGMDGLVVLDVDAIDDGNEVQMTNTAAFKD